MSKKEALDAIMEIVHAVAYAEGSGGSYDGNPEKEIETILDQITNKQTV